MTSVVWKCFFYAVPFPWWFRFLEKSAHLVQKIQFYQKPANKQSWKLFKVKFWPKPNMQNSTAQNN